MQEINSLLKYNNNNFYLIYITMILSLLYYDMIK